MEPVENPYAPSNEVASEPVVDKRAGLPLPVYSRAITYGIAWLPALFLASFGAPKFNALFCRLREREALPALTEWLLWFSLLNEALIFTPLVLVVVLFVIADHCVAALWRRSKRKWWAWYVGVVVVGILSSAVAVIALVLPIAGTIPQTGKTRT